MSASCSSSLTLSVHILLDYEKNKREILSFPNQSLTDILETPIL